MPVKQTKTSRSSNNKYKKNKNNKSTSISKSTTIKLAKKPSSKKKKVKKKPKPNLLTKIQNFFEDQKKKFKKIWKKFKDTIFQKEIYTKGKEPPKSYSFEKKFYSLYILFFFYSFLLLWGINDPNNIIINFLMLGNPFAFGNALILLFIFLSFLISSDKIREFIYEEHTAIKQIVIYSGIFIFFYLSLSFIFKTTKINFITYLLILSMIWLILLSARFYMYSRKFSTRIESKFISKYSIPRYGIALMIPFIILFILVIISIFYSNILMFIALEFLGSSDPSGGEKVYNTTRKLIMPLIYFSLVLTLLFIIFEFIFTRRRAETKRAGTFDNFTFSLIVLFIFFFQLFQITIFLLLRPETVEALKNTVGATSNTVTFLFIIEFAISMYFLYRIILKLGETFGWRVMFFKKDGLILFILACVLAQTLTRYALSTLISNQEVTGLGVWLLADRYIISVLMILILGITLLIYYLKPHETSMFLRLQKETVKEEDKSMEIIYKIIRSEYIRRGESFPLHILERDLIKSTMLSKGIVYSLIKRLADKDMNIQIINTRDKNGHPIKLIDFISVTEQFEKKQIAQKKASQYMSKRFLDTISAKKRKTISLGKGFKADTSTHQFIRSLTSGYSKKQKDIEEWQKKQKVNAQLFKKEIMAENIKNTILNIIKKEYLYRIENPETYSDFHLPISQITEEVQVLTKISPGELYPMIEKMSKEDFELALIANPKEPEDKKIKFIPLSDDNMCYTLANFRPEEYNQIIKIATKKFLNSIKAKKNNTVLANLKRKIKGENDVQKTWLGILTKLYNYYPIYDKQLKYVPNKMKLLKQINTIINSSEKKKKK
ncbi:MAG: hypothetical protein ACTSPD_05890 [Promethearchaeota archaeon]